MALTLVYKDANFSANKIETVVLGDPIPCTGISLNKQSDEINSIGGTSQLTTTLTPQDTTDTVSWTSSDTGVAVVVNGVVTAVSLGTATITATCGTQSATCAITVDNVVPNYVAVCGYAPCKRSSGSHAMTTDKRTSENSNAYIIAADQATGLYPIESKSDIDTSPYRFVPILIPDGATKIKVSNNIGAYYTRFLWIDSTQVEELSNIGAYCVEGAQSGWDQGSSITEDYTKTIPTVSGLDSFCLCVTTGGAVAQRTTGEDYADDIIISFLAE